MCEDVRLRGFMCVCVRACERACVRACVGESVCGWLWGGWGAGGVCRYVYAKTKIDYSTYA